MAFDGERQLIPDLNQAHHEEHSGTKHDARRLQHRAEADCFYAARDTLFWRASPLPCQRRDV